MNNVAILIIYYDCAGNGDLGECHSEIAAEVVLEEHEISQDANQTFLEEHGWLLVGDLVYCPVCRFELHD